MYLYLDRKQVICKCWLPVYSGPAFQYCMELLHRCLPCPWRRQRALLVSMGTLFNVSLSAYQNCTKRGREGGRKTGRAEGAREREREEKSNNAISTGSLNDATLATIWHPDKRGPDRVSGLFFDYIPYCKQEDKTPPQSFLVNFYPFCDSIIVPIVLACTLGQKPSFRLVFLR